MQGPSGKEYLLDRPTCALLEQDRRLEEEERTNNEQIKQEKAFYTGKTFTKNRENE